MKKLGNKFPYFLNSPHQNHTDRIFSYTLNIDEQNPSRAYSIRVNRINYLPSREKQQRLLLKLCLCIPVLL